MSKILIVISLVAILATLGWWGYDCKRYGDILYYTKTAKMTTVKEVDPLFGTTVEKTSTEPGHWLGLLDVDPPFGAAPMCGAWAVVGVLGVIIGRRSKK